MNKELTFATAMKDCPDEWVNVDAQKTIDELMWSTIIELDLINSHGSDYNNLHHMTKKRALRQCKEFLAKYKAFAAEDTKSAMMEYNIY